MTRPSGDPGAIDVAARVLAESPDARLRVERDGPLGALTTYRVGGPAALVVTVGDASGLGRVAAAVEASGLAVLVVGRGSNLLVSDAGFPGLAVVLDAGDDAFGALTVASATVVAGAAVPLPALARRSTDAGLTGLEWAVGVPGSVGGGVRMNAGGHGSDIASHLSRAWVLDLSDPTASVQSWSVADLAYGYRRSAITAHHVVIAAEFELASGDATVGREQIREIVRWRREHQPGGQNAGSVFTNPPGLSAGWLIESAGCKGRRYGSAEVSTKHANFVQADPSGSADDVAALIRIVQAEVRSAHGVDLHTEVRLVGFPRQPFTCDGGSP